MSDPTTGSMTFYSTEEIDIAVALIYDGFRDSLDDRGKVRFDNNIPNGEHTVFEKLLYGVGFTDIHTVPDSVNNAPQYTAEYEDKWTDHLYPLLEYLANLGMGFYGTFEDGDGEGGFALTAELGSGIIHNDSLVEIPAGRLKTLTEKSAILDRLGSLLAGEGSPSILLAQARTLLSSTLEGTP